MQINTLDELVYVNKKRKEIMEKEEERSSYIIDLKNPGVRRIW